jgi:hypothetical protein
VRYRVPKITLLRMGLNIAIDYVVGIVTGGGRLARRVVEVESQEPRADQKRATVSAEEARAGSASDWLFVAELCSADRLAVGSAFVSSIFCTALNIEATRRSDD